MFDTNQFGLFTYRLVSSVIRVMGDTFTELKEHEIKITEIIKKEEANFCKTLAKVRAGSAIRRLIKVTPFLYMLFPNLPPFCSNYVGCT